MIPSTPVKPAPNPAGEPQASRRATMVLNIALAAVAAVVILSNLLFFPLGARDARRSAERTPAPASSPASAPVLVELPTPVSREAAPPVAPEPPAAKDETATNDTAALPRIEPAAPPPVPDTAGRDSDGLGAEAPRVPDTAPQVVASLPPASESVSETPAPAPPPPAQASATAVRTPALSSSEIEALTQRGDALLMTGDIVAARYAYERAALAGSGHAATGMGKTFDPLFLAAAGVRGIQGNPFEAAAWYRKGSAAGDSEAATRLRALQSQFPE